MREKLLFSQENGSTEGEVDRSGVEEDHVVLGFSPVEISGTGLGMEEEDVGYEPMLGVVRKHDVMGERDKRGTDGRMSGAQRILYI